MLLFDNNIGMNFINSFIKNILFLFRISYTFCITWLFYYYWLDDYNLFIDKLTSQLASINILYVKIFQAFALNNSFIDENTNNRLLQFTDQAPWTYDDIDFEKLTKVCDKHNILLKGGYDGPMNAGMISVVFKGFRKENLNLQVVIKIKRKNIENRLDEAINNLQFFIFILSIIPFVKKYKLLDIVEKNIEIVRCQTNFLQEVDNMALIEENCKLLKYIKIPKANRSITEEFPDIIVMDYIQGKKITQINDVDYEGFAKQVVKFGFVTTVIHGVTHGDLHSGNILFIKDEQDSKYPYKLGILDFGIIYKLDQKYRESSFDSVTQMFEVPAKETAIKLLNSCIEPKDVLQNISKTHYENIVGFTEEIINEAVHSSKKANQIQIYKFLLQLNDYLTKTELFELGIKPSNEFVKTQLVLAMSHGVTLTLCKGEFFGFMDKVLNELFHMEILLDNCDSSL
jgi:predicted unusual protein kinase regulating ubiquinone biosynthesis (AarF/ABC1/UbiB family)